MKKWQALLGGWALALAQASGALGADLHPRAPIYKAPVASPIYSWTGCYIGANVGYGWRNSTSTYTDDPNARDPIQGLGGVLPPSYGTDRQGWLGGGQAGCNWQSSRWVFGIEGDFDGMGLTKSVAVSRPVAGGLTGTAISPAGTVLLLGNTVLANEQVSEHWLSTVRGRIGYTPMDRLYVFGTGGLAIGEVSTSGAVTAGITNPTGASIIWSGATSTTKIGFSAGAGAEYALTDHWNIKGEYIYFDLGNVKHPLGVTANTIGVTPFATLGNTTTRIDGNLVRAGVNYKF